MFSVIALGAWVQRRAETLAHFVGVNRIRLGAVFYWQLPEARLEFGTLFHHDDDNAVSEILVHVPVLLRYR